MAKKLLSRQEREHQAKSKAKAILLTRKISLKLRTIFKFKINNRSAIAKNVKD